MRRFPLLRDHKASDLSPPPEASVDPGRVRRREDVVEGTFQWPHDAVFRPLVGIYAEGRLQQLGTTYRRPFHERRSWPCCFSITLSEDLAEREDLTVAVFETGDVLNAPTLPDTGIQTVEDLITKASRLARPYSFGGFASFLLFPLNDQIEIICRDLLDRNASPKEIAHYRAKVIDGAFSILGVRDDIALSDEAQEALATLTIHERRGRACLWQGLEEALDYMVPPPLAREDVVFDSPPCLRSAFEEILIPSDVRSILAVNAVGETADIGAYAQWTKTFQDTVSAVERRVFRSIELRQQQTARAKRYRLGNILAVMKVGPAAARLPGGAVTATRPGVVVYGPYMSLAPGRHTVTFSLRNEAASADPLRLSLEAVHGEILFAHREVRLQAPAQARYALTFTVPSGCQDLLQQQRFEFRLSTNGAADIHLDGITLQMAEDADVAATSHPAVDNWLALLTTESAGARAEDDTLHGLVSSGRVFFGPYCRLLPGGYALTFEYQTELGGEVELEVVAGSDSILSRKRFTMVPGGEPQALRFEIADTDMAEELAGPLEFRLWKAEGFTFQCLALWLTALGEGVA